MRQRKGGTVLHLFIDTLPDFRQLHVSEYVISCFGLLPKLYRFGRSSTQPEAKFQCSTHKSHLSKLTGGKGRPSGAIVSLRWRASTDGERLELVDGGGVFTAAA